MRVWLKGFHFTFKCPAAINVWKLLWVYLKFCDIKNSVLSAFHPLRSDTFPPSCLPSSRLSNTCELQLTSYFEAIELIFFMFFFSGYIFSAARRLGFISVKFLSVWVGLNLEGHRITWVQLTSFVSCKSPLLDMCLFSHCLSCGWKTISLWVLGGIKKILWWLLSFSSR